MGMGHRAEAGAVVGGPSEHQASLLLPELLHGPLRSPATSWLTPSPPATGSHLFSNTARTVTLLLPKLHSSPLPTE